MLKRIGSIAYLFAIVCILHCQALAANDEYGAFIKRLQACFHDYNKDYFPQLMVILMKQQEKHESSLYTSLCYISNTNDLRSVAIAYIDRLEEEQVREILELYSTAYRQAQSDLGLTGELSESAMLQWIDHNRGPMAATLRELTKTVGTTMFKSEMVTFLIDRARSIEYVAASLPDKSITSAVGWLSKTPIVPSYAIMSIPVGMEIVRSTYLWSQGQISKKRAAANILESAANVGGASAGCVTGSTVGSMAGPVGTVAGCVAGAMIGSKMAGEAAHWTLERLFSLSPNAATDKAYEYIGLSPWAADDVVARKLRELRREASPDKGGSHEKFVEQEAFISLIKIHRKALSPEEKRWFGAKTEL